MHFQRSRRHCFPEELDLFNLYILFFVEYQLVPGKVTFLQQYFVRPAIKDLHFQQDNHNPALFVYDYVFGVESLITGWVSGEYFIKAEELGERVEI